jgi:hypothetical protein
VTDGQHFTEAAWVSNQRSISLALRPHGHVEASWHPAPCVAHNDATCADREETNSANPTGNHARRAENSSKVSIT